MTSRRYESVCEDEDDFLLQHRNRLEAETLQQQLWDNRVSIAALVKHHLNLGQLDVCAVLPPESWVRGGFNICVPVEVTKHRAPQKWVIFRCPMPHKHAEDKYPGTVTEKLSYEMASYIWMQAFCKDVRIPHLYAFGFSDGSHFTHVRHRPFYYRLYHGVRRWLHRFLGFPFLSNYSANVSTPASPTAYSILEYIDPTIGQMLSLTWPQHRHDPVRRNRLYHGLARIMLALARIPQFSIGAYGFNRDGTITLRNRPLMCSTMIMENSGAPRTINPQQTYQNVENFASDMLTLHDQYLLRQPHAVRNTDDAHARFAIRTLLRAVSHHFTKTCQQDGPYILQLTDFHQSNIFVDDEWNVTAVIDLEWICSLPAEMLSVPYWLTDCGIESIVGEQYDHFDQARKEFLGIMDEEAKRPSMKPEHDLRITQIMRETWLSKAVWFWACLRSINGWLFLVEDHLLPKFSTNKRLVSDLKGASALWQEDINSIVEAKVRDEDNYQKELRALFAT